MQSDDTASERFKDVACATLNEQHLREFIEAFREEFNEQLSRGEASVMLTQLVQFYLHISRSPPNVAGD
jgi:hypothetical protein